MDSNASCSLFVTRGIDRSTSVERKVIRAGKVLSNDADTRNFYYGAHRSSLAVAAHARLLAHGDATSISFVVSFPFFLPTYIPPGNLMRNSMSAIVRL